MASPDDDWKFRYRLNWWLKITLAHTLDKKIISRIPVRVTRTDMVAVVSPPCGVPGSLASRMRRTYMWGQRYGDLRSR
jgi:hypothetical protein